MTAPQVRWISQHLQDSTPPWTIRRSLSLAQCSVPQASTAQLMLCNGRQSLKLSVQLYIQCRLALQCAKCLVMDMCNVQWTVNNVQHEMCNGTVHCVTQVGVEGNGRWLAPSLLVSGDTRAGDVQWTTFLRTRSRGVQWTTFHFSSRNTGNIVCAMKHI